MERAVVGEGGAGETVPGYDATPHRRAELVDGGLVKIVNKVAVEYEWFRATYPEPGLPR